MRHISPLSSAAFVLISTFFVPSALIADSVSKLRLERSTDMQNWEAVPVTPGMLDANGEIVVVNHSSQEFFRMAVQVLEVPEDFALIPGGTFSMGSTNGDTVNDAPSVNVYVSEFYIAKYEVTKVLWDEVSTWAANHSYTDLGVGGGKAANHPVHSVTWWDVVKWCNARSERDGLTPVYLNADGTVFKTGTTLPTANWNANGYRLPTEAEWEKAARGGVSGQRFSWGLEINHTHANYRADGSAYTYDTSPYTSPTFHPDYNDGTVPHTSPVGSFSPNGYGLYDMAGNVWEWCWDRFSTYYYTEGAIDPRGPVAGGVGARVLRGGSWQSQAAQARPARRRSNLPGDTDSRMGFRPARSVP